MPFRKRLRNSRSGVSSLRNVASQSRDVPWGEPVAVLATRIFPTPAFLLLLFTPALPAEMNYLRDTGVSHSHIRAISVVVARQTFAMISMLLSALIAGIAFRTQLDLPADHRGFPDGIRKAYGASVGLVLIAVLFAWSSLNARTRLMASVARCARLMLLLGKPESGDPYLLRLRLRDRAFCRRRVAGVAWALTRDTARLNGRSATAGSTAGELLLWFADSPGDGRRLPTVSGYLGEFTAALCAGAQLPALQFGPADRFRTRSPRESIMRQVRSVASGTLATGIVIAFITAALRVWFK